MGMNQIQKMQRFLFSAFSAQNHTRRALAGDGVWSLNVFLPNYHLAVAWQAGKGFGVVSDDSHGYGEGADEVFEDMNRRSPGSSSSSPTGSLPCPPRPSGLRTCARNSACLRRKSAGGSGRNRLPSPRGSEVRFPCLHPAGVCRSLRGQARCEDDLPRCDQEGTPAERRIHGGGCEMKLNLLVLRTSKLEDLRKFYSALGACFKSERHGNGPETTPPRSATTWFSNSTRCSTVRRRTPGCDSD